jgi:hypothetical protein
VARVHPWGSKVHPQGRINLPLSRFQAIFSKAGYHVLKEFRYDEMLDLRGKPIIWDYREHEITRLVYMKL